jgi:hypothetical protein
MLPECNHDTGLVLRPLERQTPEQQWCGTWYDCPSPGCSFSRLEPSAALLAQLAEMRTTAAPVLPDPPAKPRKPRRRVA